jgi:hypothetical protein
MLQFVGMLFYSITIQKVGGFLINTELSSSDYAGIMVEAVENLIVKVSRVLPKDNESNLPLKIEGEVLNEWKKYTLKYFRSSPNAFLAESEFF